jgi:DNA-binding LytR/AlgR family response regulator
MLNEPRIAICDDEQAQREILERCIRDCGYWKETKPIVELFQRGADLVQRVASGTTYSYIFLDIQMPDSDGIEICRQILQISKQPIIFVSTHMEYQPIIDELFPAMLLSKPYTAENLNNMLIGYNARSEAQNPFVYHSGSALHKIQMKEIVYISAERECIKVHLWDAQITVFDMTLTQIATDYAKQGLFKCHKSYVINLRHYLMNTYKEVHLRSGEKVVHVPLSREMASGNRIRNIYLDFSDRGFYVK